MEIVTIPYQRIVYNIRIPGLPTNEVHINTCFDGISTVWNYFVKSKVSKFVRLKCLDIKFQAKLVDLVFKSNLGCVKIKVKTNYWS